MKFRSGFVSNSSSSSFVIKLEDITAKQLKQIESHILVAKKLGMSFCHPYDAWYVETSTDTINGSITMDNFNMAEFLNLIGVPDEVIIWDRDGDR